MSGYPESEESEEEANAEADASAPPGETDAQGKKNFEATNPKRAKRAKKAAKKTKMKESIIDSFAAQIELAFGSQSDSVQGNDIF